ncbi:hypothetical protein [Ulvibacterium sp.]|uniref:hypothetical protein n=1 Tax=Ulvibacterium sp. TaxID=2665914 RepID=UPI002614FC76|nr:hypothetical protein [Ulvibacterium sp.]
MLVIGNYVRLTRFFGILRRKASLVLLAAILGMSNAILEEDRTLYDNRNYLEEREFPSYDEPH